jgi:hypothetical protein
MNSSPPSRLRAPDLVRIAGERAPAPPCAQCATLACPGWESLAAEFDRARLRQLGTLRDPANEDPTVREHHPGGTHAWSADAPIAPAYFPYNRCDVWACITCARPFLRYTEYGGYYVDERIRELAAALVTDAPLVD